MKGIFMKRFAITTLFVLGLTLLAMPSFAQQESRFDLKINGRVAIPGRVLPAGAYVFRLMNSDTYPQIVEVMSADGTSTYGLFHVVPAQRLEAGDSQVTLTDPDSAGLQSVSEWYFPGTMDGYQFVYSRKDIQKEDRIAQRLATQTNSGL
jgi:hypothetical protein